MAFHTKFQRVQRQASRIMFDKIDGFISIHDGIRYLAPFYDGRCDKICNGIKFLGS